MQELEAAELPMVLKSTESPTQEVLSVPQQVLKLTGEMLHYLEQREHDIKFEWAFPLFLLVPLCLSSVLRTHQPVNVIRPQRTLRCSSVLIPQDRLASHRPHLPAMLPDSQALILTLL